jgi:hypothetical protein
MADSAEQGRARFLLFAYTHYKINRKYPLGPTRRPLWDSKNFELCQLFTSNEEQGRVPADPLQRVLHISVVR